MLIAFHHPSRSVPQPHAERLRRQAGYLSADWSGNAARNIAAACGSCPVQAAPGFSVVTEDLKSRPHLIQMPRLQPFGQLVHSKRSLSSCRRPHLDRRPGHGCAEFLALQQFQEVQGMGVATGTPASTSIGGDTRG